MSQLAECKSLKIESIAPKKQKSKKKDIGHVQIIDDDAPISWDTTAESETIADNEIVSFEDAPVVVGIIDERPSEVREKERFKDVKCWRTAAFEEVLESDSIGPQPKPSTSSNSQQKQKLSDDSDPDIDRRQSARNHDLDLSPPRRKIQQNDDDLSPPRRKRPSKDDSNPSRQLNTSFRRQKYDDSSSRRKYRTVADSNSSKRYNSSSDRREHKYKDDRNLLKQSDSSPPRKRQVPDDDSSSSRSRDKSLLSHRKDDQHSRQETSFPSVIHRHQPKEEPLLTSTNSQSKQQLSSELVKSQRRRLAEHKEQIAERYAQWGRGLVQVRQVEEAARDYLVESAKPLARYRDDADLDTMLKNREREDDPMLKYLSNKKSDTSDRTNSSNSAPVKPRYKGPEPQKNRFDIWPGYRWDGVDRSNGYEKKLFESVANRHAKSQEAYLWSVEDM